MSVRGWTRARRALSALLVVFATAVVYGQAAAPVTTVHCSHTWVGKEAAIEEQMRTAPVLRMEDVPIGVTKPKRAVLAAGGPVSYFAWKPLGVAMRGGYRESYKAEIAAYHLDLLLGMHMVPPVVQRELDGTTGAATFWIEPVNGWDKKNPPKGVEPGWSRQVSAMKLFDQLIANTDRNQGNLLYDDDWHLFLIDHSRAFTTTKSIKVSAAPTRVAYELWKRMDALTAEELKGALGEWLSDGEITAMLARRDSMRKTIGEMVKKRGEEDVFLR